LHHFNNKKKLIENVIYEPLLNHFVKGVLYVVRIALLLHHPL